PIDLNCFPHGGDFTENGYTTEEIKLENETRKILGDQSIAITATVVRIPVVGGHSETVNIEFEHDFELADIVNLLSNAPGIVVQDKPEENLYPMPLTAHDKDEVFVGRIRRDFSRPKSLNMWVVSDNLRKGAATNAIQIAETLTEKKFV
ncbi:MAG TPA: Asd/ArgC dimerization domain-containing protein, partial [Bacteroidales bacterium]|nr:Asd/ArgC dimerization domain-containing protein [Bacteroidales bacterium]